MPELLKRKAFTKSEICTKALEKYLMQSDSVRLFCSEMCEAQQYTVTGDSLFKAYKAYCNDSLLHAVGRTKFYQRLETLTHSRVDYGNVVNFKLKLKES